MMDMKKTEDAMKKGFYNYTSAAVCACKSNVGWKGYIAGCVFAIASGIYAFYYDSKCRKHIETGDGYFKTALDSFDKEVADAGNSKED